MIYGRQFVVICRCEYGLTVLSTLSAAKLSLPTVRNQNLLTSETRPEQVGGSGVVDRRFGPVGHGYATAEVRLRWWVGWAMSSAWLWSSPSQTDPSLALPVDATTLATVRRWVRDLVAGRADRRSMTRSRWLMSWSATPTGTADHRAPCTSP